APSPLRLVDLPRGLTALQRTDDALPLGAARPPSQPGSLEDLQGGKSRHLLLSSGTPPSPITLPASPGRSKPPKPVANLFALGRALTSSSAPPRRAPGTATPARGAAASSSRSAPTPRRGSPAG